MDDATSEKTANEPVAIGPGGGMNFDRLEGLEESVTEEKADQVIEKAKETKAMQTAVESLSENGEITEAEKVRIIKALAGDSEIDIPENAVFKHKDKEFTARDLLDSAMAQPEIHRKFSEADQMEKNAKALIEKLRADEAFVNGNLKKMLEMSAKGNHWDALQFMAEMAGEEDTVGYQKQLVEQAMEIATKFGNMTEDEERAFWAEQKNKYLETENAKKLKATEAQLKAKEEEDAARRVIYGHGLTEAEFSEAYEFLKKEGALEKVKGMNTQEAATAICGFYKDVQLENRIVDACKSVDEGLLKNRTLLDSLFKLANHEDTVEDLKEILEEYIADSSDPEEDDEQDDDPPKESRTKKVASKKKAARSEKVDSKGKKKEKTEEVLEDPEDVVGFDDILEVVRGS